MHGPRADGRAIGLRARDSSSSQPRRLLLLLFSAQRPLDALPGWMETVSQVLPLTHGIEAAREIAAGASLSDVSTLVWTEAAIGAPYALLASLSPVLEEEGRRRATLEAI